MLWSTYGVLLLLSICVLLTTACGGTPPPPLHSLSDLEITNTPSTLPTVTSTGNQILKIAIATSQTHLSTYPGGLMSLAAITSPYALCSFVIDYGSGRPANAPGMEPRIADASGKVSWQWHVELGAHTGFWPVTVNALLPNGTRSEAKASAQVTLPPMSIQSSQTRLSGVRGANLALAITTAPAVHCWLLLNYGPGLPARSLPQVTGANGVATWNWRISNVAHVGAWPLRITIQLADGESTEDWVTMTIV